MPISIAFVTSLPRWGGGEKWFLETAAAMQRRGHRVCIVGQPASEIVRRAGSRGLHAHSIAMHGIFDPRTLLRLGLVLRRERVDVAVVNQAREIRLVALSQLGRPGFRLIARRGSPDRIKNVWHFRFVYTHWVDRMIVNAQALIERICADAPWYDRDRIEVIPNGIDVDGCDASANPSRARTSLGLRPTDRLISMVGEVGWRKDQATFVRAVRHLLERHPDDRLVFAIAGEGPERPRLQAEARAMGLDAPHLRWLGFREDVPDLLAASELVVLPSREEGFPNTLLEAMAHGRCVVATPVDGIPELVVDGECGLLVPTGDFARLADAMHALLDDAALRTRLGDAGRRRAREHFDQTAMMDRVERLLLGL